MKKLVQIFAIFALLFATALTIAPSAQSSAAEKTITIKKSGYVADTFNGVDAIYRPGGSDGSDSTYSCAAYVKKYYKEIYGTSLSNMFASATPISDNDTLIKVTEANVGDIVKEYTDHGTCHWSIVKEVNEDGTFVVIEQNFKWRSGGTTFAKTGRELSPDSVTIYRLESENDAVHKVVELKTNKK
ncbi:hypothetical protein [Anaerolentibacter hominis]|uniref:hypothetical protein n=1 Tax=Anaerolentibacter hominis TaxID=3079009 RepID=UPI0031B84BC7